MSEQWVWGFVVFWFVVQALRGEIVSIFKKWLEEDDHIQNKNREDVFEYRWYTNPCGDIVIEERSTRTGLTHKSVLTSEQASMVSRLFEAVRGPMPDSGEIS